MSSGLEDYSMKSTFRAKQDLSFHAFDVLLIGINFLAFIAVLFFNIAATIPIQVLFESSTPSDILIKYPIGITPSDWNYNFITWGVIYGWTALWILFNVSLIFSINRYGRMHKHPPVFTKQFQLFVCSNFMLNIAWLFLWNAEHLGVKKDFYFVFDLNTVMENQVKYCYLY